MNGVWILENITALKVLHLKISIYYYDGQLFQYYVLNSICVSLNVVHLPNHCFCISGDLAVDLLFSWLFNHLSFVIEMCLVLLCDKTTSPMKHHNNTVS